ncbi:hypothetical protein [Nocardioides plantarum]|uniref:Uncharacterized protein n=1 Tax=Nocardioides plantarum TaxID=29299 RepID=A0ABV5KF52_9ACTN|nr:hypothetical protein [Nocardioides plantarum]
MSDPAPPTRFGGDAPDGETGERNVVLRTLLRLRSVLVLVPLLAGLLIAAAIGAGMLWADIPDRQLTGPDVTCWDGQSAPVTDCTEPRGRRGLHWVFPSYQIRDERCVPLERRGSSSPYQVACALRFDQRPVTVTYTARSSADDLLKALRASYGAKPVSEADGERLVFRGSSAGSNGLYRVTVAYAGHPFSVTVEAPDRRVRDTALDELVTFRPADQVVVRQS